MYVNVHVRRRHTDVCIPRYTHTYVHILLVHTYTHSSRCSRGTCMSCTTGVPVHVHSIFNYLLCFFYFKSLRVHNYMTYMTCSHLLYMYLLGIQVALICLLIPTLFRAIYTSNIPVKVQSTCRRGISVPVVCSTWRKRRRR